jgi:DeoR family glycerol-3-phosphate regulon repressor
LHAFVWLRIDSFYPKQAHPTSGQSPVAVGTIWTYLCHPEQWSAWPLLDVDPAARPEEMPRRTPTPRPRVPRPFTPNPRQSDLLAVVREHGVITVEAMAEQFGVTLQTVRRDVGLLADAGLLARFHGGARVPSSTTENLGYGQRQHLNEAAKRQIARAVARAVPEGCSMIINIGTTTEAVARELLQHKGLRVITNNLNVAAILSDNPDCEVIVAGGLVRSRDRGIIGEPTVEFMRQFRVDIGLIGISGIEADGTLRDFDYREVKVARTIIEQSRQVWLAADHSKFNRPAMVELAQLSHIDCLFTDREPSQPFAALLREADVRCVVAEG